MQFPIMAFITALAIFLLLLETRLATVALDKPNHRSLHTRLTPRTGGVGVIISTLLIWLVAGISSVWIVPVLFLLFISLLDDMRGLSVRWRLLAQLLTSSVAVGFLMPGAHLLLQVLAVLGITWLINLYNFMDGSDGLAGGMAIFGFGSYAIAAGMGDFQPLTVMSSVIVASCIAFLIFNFHPARIFLGDSGSVPLGFLAGALGLYGWQVGAWPIWFPLLVFSPFIMDATIVLIKRMTLGERVWEAHKNHYYQRLIRMGWSHRTTALAEYALMILVGSSAILLKEQSQFVVLFGLSLWLVTYLSVMILIDKLWVKHQLAQVQQ